MSAFRGSILQFRGGGPIDEGAVVDSGAHRPAGDLTWDAFLDEHAATILAAIRPFARTYDERMDLFLFVCAALRSDGMRRVRRYRYRPEAPCRFSTYLAVVVRNLVLDHERARRGRYRAFSSMARLDAIDRRIVAYRFRDGRPLDEVRERLERRHGVRLEPQELAERVARVERSLSPSQRWRLLSRWTWRQPTIPIDCVSVVAEQTSRTFALAASGRDPERSLEERQAERAFARAVAGLAPRQQLVLAVRFRDGLDVGTAAKAIGVSGAEIERTTRDALAAIRSALGEARITRDDLEGAFGAGWSSWEAQT